MFKFRLTIITLILIFISGCALKQEPKKIQKECIIANTKAPNWVCMPYKQENQYSVKTTAFINKEKEKSLSDEALLNAKRKMIDEIKVDINNKANSYVKSMGENNNTEMVDRITNKLLKEILSLNMKMQINSWKTADNMSLYLLLTMDKTDLNNIINSGIKNLANGNVQIKDSEDALNRLD